MAGCPLSNVVAQLHGMRKQGNALLARCPAHDDHHPSLKITETDDGTVLLKCWAGCSTSEIVGAIGLELRDLFPGNSGNYVPSAPSINPELLELAQYTVQIGSRWIQQSVPFSEKSRRDFLKAVKIVEAYGLGDDSWLNDPESEPVGPMILRSGMSWKRTSNKSMTS